MLNNTQLVTIGIPTYNRCKLLEVAIASALAQTYKNIELIISDNASSDETSEVCRRWATIDKRVNYHRQTVNEGAVKNFNLVSAAANGSYFMWLADDDQISANYIEECISILESNPKASIASGQAILRHPDGRQQKRICISAVSSIRWLRVIKYLFLVSDNSGFYGLMRTDVVQRNSIKNIFAGDWLWVMSLAFLGHLKIAPKATLWRSADGESSNSEKFMKSYGYTPLQRAFPYLKIGSAVRAEIITSQIFVDSTKVYERHVGSFAAACSLVLGQGVFWKGISLLSSLLRKTVGQLLYDKLRRTVRAWVGI